MAHTSRAFIQCIKVFLWYLYFRSYTNFFCGAIKVQHRNAAEEAVSIKYICWYGRHFKQSYQVISSKEEKNFCDGLLWIYDIHKGIKTSGKKCFVQNLSLLLWTEEAKKKKNSLGFKREWKCMLFSKNFQMKNIGKNNFFQNFNRKKRNIH